MNIQVVLTYDNFLNENCQALLFPGVTFANFDKCGDVMLADLPPNGDCFHPTSLEGMTYRSANKLDVFFEQMNPKLGFINSADCVDMACDARKKILITDIDGTTLGEVGYTI